MIRKYQVIRSPVEAVQWDGSEEQALGEIASFTAFGAGLAGNGRWMDLCINYETRSYERVSPRDWVLKLQDGSLSRMDDALFRRFYEPVD